MATITIFSDLEPRKIRSDTVSTVSPSISHELVGPDAMIFIFCSKFGVTSISEVIDISPNSIDSSLCFIQSSVSQGINPFINKGFLRSVIDFGEAANNVN